ncbi:MAG TPA: ABC transporter ATP-binding protein [Mycobacteriales bacterium]|nr:ABC transporter ATP-binding protein [Mycobacteriales bacterium]
MSMNGGWQTMHSFRRDPSVAQRKLAAGTYGRILRLARPYRRHLVAFLGLILIDSAIGAGLPLIYKAIINDGVQKHDVGLVEALAALVAGLALLDAAVSLANRWFSSRIGEGLIYDLRALVFDHVQRQPIAFFTRTQTGALVTRLNSDVIGAQSAFTNTLSSVSSNVISVAFVLSVMFTLSWQITLLSLALVPIFVLPARLMGGRLREITRESYQLDAAMGQQMTERFGVSGALLVKLFGRPEDEDRAFRDRAARVRDIGVKQAMYGRIFFVSLTLVASLGLAITYGLGGRFAAEGSIDVGTLVALTAYLQRLYGPLTSLSNVRVDVMTALVSFERVFEVLDLPPAVADREGAQDLPADAPATVELEHVAFAYPSAKDVSLASLESVAVLDARPSEQVLHDVSFRAEPGQLVALVGPSGAGKTTISSLIPRLYDVNAGAVRVGGFDVRDLTLSSLGAAVGVVTQDSHLFHDTLRSNLELARPGATDDELLAALDAAQVGALVRSLPDGLDTVVGERGYRLSGGEKQRVAIARLLLKAPRVVVLDEATAHLDSESEAAVQKALSVALVGRTSIVIAHRLSTVVNADQILVLDGGRIVERGRHADLLAQGGLYAELFRTQFEHQPAPVA